MKGVYRIHTVTGTSSNRLKKLNTKLMPSYGVSLQHTVSLKTFRSFCVSEQKCGKHILHVKDTCSLVLNRETMAHMPVLFLI